MSSAPASSATTGHHRPRLGFLGTGWIGRNRLEAIATDGAAVVAAVSDPSPEAAAQAAAAAPGAVVVESLDALLALDLDGLVIATPSALHAEQAIAALARGVAVFCQKPLARTAAETRRVVRAARAADRLLGVDLSYRETAAMRAVRGVVDGGEIGPVYAVDLTFHNAYGPDKGWFYDPQLAGGGCVIDLGIHLVDLALWTLGWPALRGASSRLYSKGTLLADTSGAVEDYAVATLDLARPDGRAVTAQLACSWHLSAGQDAVIEATFYGERGGAALRNVGGSFYDFVADRFDGTRQVRLVDPPDAWGGRAAVAWARQLAAGARFDVEAERLVEVAAALDAVYGRVDDGDGGAPEIGAAVGIH